jgi:hypothetical protein
VDGQPRAATTSLPSAVPASRHDRLLHTAADGTPESRMLLPHDGAPPSARPPYRWRVGG